LKGKCDVRELQSGGLMISKREVGLTLFWMGFAYMVGMGWLAGWWVTDTARTSTLEEISLTAWAFDRPLFWLWAFSVPAGSILAGIGILLRGGSKRTHTWIFGIGMVLALTLIQFAPTGTHRPPLFGVLGGLILALFLLMLWFWAKRRAHLEGVAKTVADLRLTGYVWLIIAMWYLCGTLGAPYLSAVAELDLGSPVPIILYLVLAWLFLFLAQYKEAKAMT
jgi:hypothetical protein